MADEERAKPEQGLLALQAEQRAIAGNPLMFQILRAAARDFADALTPHIAAQQALTPGNQRMWDLVRYFRTQALDKQLISEDEYTALAKDHPAVKRLEDYDAAVEALTAERDALRAAGDALADGVESHHPGSRDWRHEESTPNCTWCSRVAAWRAVASREGNDD